MRSLTNNAMDSLAHDGIERMCEVCHGAIKRGDGRYRIGEREYHPDCFKFWLTTPSRRGREP
jgi:hypothetical protein